MCQHSFSSARRSRYEVLSCQPHWHLIVSDGVFCPDGDFYHLWNWDVDSILEDLRSSYDESTGKVRCRSKRGGHMEWHATEFLAVLSRHVPRPRQHLVTPAR